MKSLASIYKKKFEEIEEINPWVSPEYILKKDFRGKVKEVCPPIKGGLHYDKTLVRFIDGTGALVNNFSGDSIIAEISEITPLTGEEYWRLRLRLLSEENLKTLRRRVEDRLRKSQDELVRAGASLINRGQIKVSDLI